MTAKMMILRGIAGTFDGIPYERGALDDRAAIAFAKLRGYEGHVLDIAGNAYVGSPQHKMALDLFRRDESFAAIYGFSGGGYNAKHVIDDLRNGEKQRLKLVVIIGAPGNPSVRYRGPWELIYHTDPTHMDGPRALLGGEYSKA